MRAPLLAAAIALTIVGAVGQERSTGGSGVTRTTDFVREVDAGYGGALRLTAGPHGSVSIRAWKERKIRVEAKIRLTAASEADLDALASAVAVVVDPSPTSVAVETMGPHDKKWMKGVKGFPKRLAALPVRVDYVVSVPEYTALAVGVTDGDTVVEGITGIIGLSSAHGDVRLSRVSGSTQIAAAGGNMTIETPDRAWHGGNLNASCSGDMRFVAPAGFSATLDASAAGGVTKVVDGEAHEAGAELDERLGNGGAGVTLVAGGKLTIELVHR
jgi:hypothetical protein